MSSAAAPARVRDLLGLLRDHRRVVLLAVLLTLAGSGLGLVQPLLAARAVTDAGAGAIPWAIAGALAAVFLAQALITAVGKFLLERTGERVVLGLRRSLIARLLRLPMPFYDQGRTGDLISRTGADTTTLRFAVAQAAVDLLTGALTAIAITVVMLWLDPLLFALVAATVATGLLLVFSALRRMRAASQETQASLGTMAADLDRALGAIRTVRASRAEHRESDRIGAHADAAYHSGVRAARLAGIVDPAVELTARGTVLLVLLVGGVRVAHNPAALGELVAFLLYATYLVAPLASMFQAVATLNRGMGALQRVWDVLTLPDEDHDQPDIGDQPTGRHEHTPPATTTPVLEFRDVRFRYQDRDVLHGVSFTVPARGIVVLAGRSGAGKSTIFALTERFYTPDSGAILLDGLDTATLSPQQCRARLALVEQNTPVLHGTLRDNITYAAPEAGPADIDRAVRLANLHDLLQRLPHGLDSPVGDRGCTLSGGEQQRIALARALITRPALLLLDEPTAHLDTVTEATLTRALATISQECALLIIAHRLTTIRNADHVLLLDAGRITANGTPDELLDTNTADQHLDDTPLTTLSG
ncbi:hypothetical protein BS329_37685 [Amycolatopsis coloradensis]|uniref:ABC transporter n=1 Tax=Amycolatopsis coloradensis TaxID=76021 RepID=A0A1R0KFQ8_9PSEU|nr:ABC transporter ATP-binding protein [Amycolatopsis coloradensis]OLZ44159.1 hypothetical protein BS329_37685 [Amycolatopsis coloradensis]